MWKDRALIPNTPGFKLVVRLASDQRREDVVTNVAPLTLERTALAHVVGWTGVDDIRLFEPHQRVQLHPATDRWMMGDRLGVVKRVDPARRIVHVKLDVSGKTLPFTIDNVLKDSVSW